MKFKIGDHVYTGYPDWGAGILLKPWEGLSAEGWYIVLDNGKTDRTIDGIPCASFYASEFKLLREQTPEEAEQARIARAAALVNRPKALRYGPFKPIARALP